MYLHNQTHCALLPLICNDFSIEGKLHNRFVNFYNSLIRSSNHCIQIIGKLIKQGSGSAASHTLNHVYHKYGLNKYRCPLPMPNSNVIDCSTSAEQLSTATAVRDFIYTRWDVSTAPQIKDDFDSSIQHLCVN